MREIRLRRVKCAAAREGDLFHFTLRRRSNISQCAIAHYFTFGKAEYFTKRGEYPGAAPPRVALFLALTLGLTYRFVCFANELGSHSAEAECNVVRGGYQKIRVYKHADKRRGNSKPKALIRKQSDKFASFSF